MTVETIHDIIRDMEANNCMAVSPLFMYTDDGEVDLSPLIDRIKSAVSREEQNRKSKGEKQ